MYVFDLHLIAMQEKNVNIGYTMKLRCIRDLEHHGSQIRRPERAALWRLIWFPRWSKSRIHRLFHRITFLYHWTLKLAFSQTKRFYKGLQNNADRLSKCHYSWASQLANVTSNDALVTTFVRRKNSDTAGFCGPVVILPCLGAWL